MNLRNYCVEHQLKMRELAVITGVSLAQLYLIANDECYNVTAETMNKIWIGTLKKFGKGLGPSEYLKILDHGQESI
jgi:predicted ribonuclease YlaK